MVDRMRGDDIDEREWIGGENYDDPFYMEWVEVKENKTGERT